jgi:hypothetical protein
MIERDLYFAAFCIKSGVEYVIGKGRVELIADDDTIDRLREEYRTEYKAQFDVLRSIHKQIQSQRKDSSPVKSLIQW